MPRTRPDYELILNLPVDVRIDHASDLCDTAERENLLEYFFAEIDKGKAALTAANETIKGLDHLNSKLTSPPWMTATFAGTVDLRGELRARVVQQGAERIVALDPSVDHAALVPGCEVFVTHQSSCVLGASPSGHCGGADCSTAVFERLDGDGRLVIRHRDEELLVRAGGHLDTKALRAGDKLLFDRAAKMAFERIESAKEHSLLVAEVPDVDPRMVGGQAQNYRRLRLALMSTLIAADKASKYGLGSRRTVLLAGPPGTGKTLMVRAIASEFTRSGHRTRVAVVKPGQLLSPYIGETEIFTRRFFEAVAAAAEEGPIIIFFDEIETIGRHRGGMTSQHMDRALGALLAEIDGFAKRGNVSIVAATNRVDLLDAALLQRISSVQITVGRPDLAAAREIFAIHLSESTPVLPNGTEAVATRMALIEQGVSLCFGPNAPNNQIARLKFRDGQERVIVARELLSGRVIEQIAEQAKAAALEREIEGGESGVCARDIEAAVAMKLDELRNVLSPENAHHHITDLPQDLSVVSVDPLRPKTNRRFYLQ